VADHFIVDGRRSRVPYRSAHGLRKADATIAAENGATIEQLKAIFGWSNNQQPATYTRAADQKKIAAGSMHLLVRPAPAPERVPPIALPKTGGDRRRKKQAISIRNENSGGLGGNRTPVEGFAVLCVATPPRGLEPFVGASR
jgi:hypothetical protein